MHGQIVLLGENLRWYHDRRLAAAFDGQQHRQQGDDGFTAADITLE
jgi:hypothetical protein